MGRLKAGGDRLREELRDAPLPSSLAAGHADTGQTATVAQNPGITADQLLKQGLHFQRSGDIDRAAVIYTHLISQQPSMLAAWTNLGVCLRIKKQYQAAVNCYRRVLEQSPDNAAALGNLANALKDMDRLGEALEAHRRVVSLKPDEPSVLVNYAVALRDGSQFSQALQQLDRAQQLRPDDPRIEWERAQNFLHLGLYHEGWKSYEARWKTGDLPLPAFTCPQWRGEDITGKSILLIPEQGYGDTILAARFITHVKQRVGRTGRVGLLCKPEMRRLLSIVGADYLLAPEDAVPQIDYYCPLMSLMGALDIAVETLAPPATLHVPAEAQKKFAALRAENAACLKVGIVWSGSITFKNNHNRALPLSQFLSLAEIPGVRLYSLQKGPRLQELHDNGAQAFVADIGSLCDDFADTAAAVNALDVIVMTDSSVAHLAASLGKPVINLLPSMPYWLYTLKPESTPWYPSMYLLRRDKTEAWKVRLMRQLAMMAQQKRATGSVAASINDTKQSDTEPKGAMQRPGLTPNNSQAHSSSNEEKSHG